jgi:hypothetical protein
VNLVQQVFELTAATCFIPHHHPLKIAINVSVIDQLSDLTFKLIWRSARKRFISPSEPIAESDVSGFSRSARKFSLRTGSYGAWLLQPGGEKLLAPLVNETTHSGFRFTQLEKIVPTRTGLGGIYCLGPMALSKRLAAACRFDDQLNAIFLTKFLL